MRILEKSRSYGGRCATRRWGEHIVDHGAQYFTVSEQRFRDELDEVLDPSALRKLAGRVVDAESGDEIPGKKGARFYYAPGNNRMGAALADGLDVRRETLVESLNPSGDGGWLVAGERCDSVVVTCPWPQAAALLGRDSAEVEYVPCLTGFFEYDGEPEGCAAERYAVMASSSNDPLSWSACENWKEGRIAAGKTVFVVQMSEGFSREFYKEAPEAWLEKAQSLLEERWGLEGKTAGSTFAHRWGFARLAEGAKQLPAGEVEGMPGVFLAGDATSGSRVESAWLSGLDVADQILAGAVTQRPQ